MNISQILAKRHRFNRSPSSPCSDSNIASLVKVFLFNILIKEWPVVDSSTQQIFIQYLSVQKIKNKKWLLLFKPQRQGAWMFCCFRWVIFKLWFTLSVSSMKGNPILLLTLPTGFSVYVDARTLSRESSVISGNEPRNCFKPHWFGGFKIWPPQLGSKEAIQQNLIIKHFSVPCPHFCLMPNGVSRVRSEVRYILFRVIRKPLIQGPLLSPCHQVYGLCCLTLWMRLISGLTFSWMCNWEINHFYCLLLEITGSNSFCHSWWLKWE